MWPGKPAGTTDPFFRAGVKTLPRNTKRSTVLSQMKSMRAGIALMVLVRRTMGRKMAVTAPTLSPRTSVEMAMIVENNNEVEVEFDR